MFKPTPICAYRLRSISRGGDRRGRDRFSNQGRRDGRSGGGSYGARDSRRDARKSMRNAAYRAVPSFAVSKISWSAELLFSLCIYLARDFRREERRTRREQEACPTLAANSTQVFGLSAVFRTSRFLRFTRTRSVSTCGAPPPPPWTPSTPVPGAVLGAQGPAPGDRVHLQPRRLRPGFETGVQVFLRLELS